MSRPEILETIVVEGRYDKNVLSQIVDAQILETGGFQIYHNEEIRKTISAAAERTGIIILTDSDASGFQIRSRIKAFVPEDRIKNAYIPDIFGKEKRKSAPGKEGKLGVEGMDREVLLTALRNAGATFTGEVCPAKDRITVTDLYRAGLTGRPDSRQRRALLLRELQLPERMSTKAMADALSRILTKEEFFRRTSEKQEEP